MYCRKSGAMLCGEMQKCVEDSRSLLSIPKRRQSLAEGKLLSVRDALQFSWGFLCLSFCCRNNTTNDRDVLGLFLSVFSSCLLFAEQISGTRSDRTRASSCLCLSPVSPPIPVPQTRSALHLPRQRTTFHHQDARQQRRLLVRENPGLRRSNSNRLC
jgi:hypothetical protein